MTLLRVFLISSLILQSCYCLTLPKTFSDGMVLQAAPTEARIWGFLDGDTNSVTNDLTCNNGEKTTLVFTPDKVTDIMLLSWKKFLSSLCTG